MVDIQLAAADIRRGKQKKKKKKKIEITGYKYNGLPYYDRATIKRSRLDDFNLTRQWANAQRDGRPAEHRWRPLFNAAKFG